MGPRLGLSRNEPRRRMEEGARRGPGLLFPRLAAHVCTHVSFAIVAFCLFFLKCVCVYIRLPSLTTAQSRSAAMVRTRRARAADAAAPLLPPPPPPLLLLLLLLLASTQLSTAASRISTRRNSLSDSAAKGAGKVTIMLSDLLCNGYTAN